MRFLASFVGYITTLLALLLALTDHDHLLYGSDWPHSPEPVVAKLITDLTSSELFNQSQLRGLWHDNARSLFPRLSSVAPSHGR